MANKLHQVKRALTRLSAAQLIDRARAHVAALTGNPHFPNPVPSLASIEAATVAVELADAERLNNDGKQDRLALRVRMSGLKDLLVLLAAHVQVASGGDAEIIVSAGFAVRRKPQPAGPLPAPANLRARLAPLRGAIHLHWRGVRHRSGYEVEIAPGDAQWRRLLAQSSTYCTVQGLESAVTYRFRVRAFGAAGQGPWSDIAVDRPR